MRQRKAVAFIIVCVSLISMFASNALAEAWKEYTFKDLGFSIASPAGWDVRALREGAFMEMVTILLPKGSARNGFRANMAIISSSKEDSSMPLEHAYKMNLENMSNSTEFPAFELINSYNIKLGKYDACQATFKYKHPKLGMTLKSFQIYAVTEERIVIIQYAAPSSTYKKYMDEVNEIVRTFKAI
ncbi:MAG: hypothetical protein ABID09_01470 [Candidatus Omnitrophota bacterium]